MNTAVTSPSLFRVKTVLRLFFAVALVLCGAFLAHVFAASKDGSAARLSEATELEAAFSERQKAVVAVEGIVRNEVDRDVVRAFGLVIDGEGRIVLSEGFLPDWVPPSRFGDFKVRLAGEAGDGVAAVYLGQDYRTGWHYVQVRDAEKWPNYRPIGDFGFADARIGQELWVIGLRNESWNYLPYLLAARMSVQIELPQPMGFADGNVASPGSAVFDMSGRFVGWASTAVVEEKMFFMQRQHYRAGVQSLNESGVFVTAPTFNELVGHIPSSAEGDRRPWMGVSGLHPLDRDVAELMGLTEQGALVISDVIADSPAAQAGLKSRDIITGIDGEPLPPLQPTFILPQWLERRLLSRQIGDTIRFTLVRGGGGAREEVAVTLRAEPTPLKLAERDYYPRLGLTARAFNLFDGIAKLQMTSDAPGVIADFIRPNGPVDSGGLMPGDWILVIDGTDITDFASARALLFAIEQDSAREEIVLLIRRNNETKVLRIKLH